MSRPLGSLGDLGMIMVKMQIMGMYEIFKTRPSSLSLYPAGLHILVRPQFRELAQLVAATKSAKLLYFGPFFLGQVIWCLFSLVKYSPRMVFSGRRNNSLPAIYATVFSSCAITGGTTFLVDYQGRCNYLSSFSVTLEALSLILLVLVVIRPMTVELIFRGQRPSPGPKKCSTRVYRF